MKKKKIDLGRKYRITLFSMSLLIMLTMVNSGYGWWTKGLDVSNSVSSGSMDIIFDNNYELLEVISLDEKPETKVHVKPECMDIDIRHACQGYTSSIGFTLINNGTIPVSYEAIVNNPDGDINIEVQKISDTIGSFNKNSLGCSGIIKVTVINANEEKHHNASVDLVFNQWNKAGGWAKVLKCNISVKTKKTVKKDELKEDSAEQVKDEAEKEPKDIDEGKVDAKDNTDKEKEEKEKNADETLSEPIGNDDQNSMTRQESTENKDIGKEAENAHIEENLSNPIDDAMTKAIGDEQKDSVAEENKDSKDDSIQNE